MNPSIPTSTNTNVGPGQHQHGNYPQSQYSQQHGQMGSTNVPPVSNPNDQQPQVTSSQTPTSLPGSYNSNVVANTNAGTGTVQPQQTAAAPPPQAGAKELNAATLCRFGQETVQEILGRAQELFQILRHVQPPDGKLIHAGLDRKPKFLETLRTIKANFKRLRVIYDKIEESFPTTDTDFEEEILAKCTADDVAYDDKRNTEAYQMAVEEYKETMDQVILRNRNLKEQIDHIRQIIWDINTMLAMRKD